MKISETKNKKGIVLAGGSGTRLKPLTDISCKQLLPVYDKPMIFYPISILMLAGIRDIAIVSTKKDIPSIENLLGDGSEYGINLTYLVQDQPNGIAEVFLIAEEFIDNDPVTLILGDNIFYGSGLDDLLEKVISLGYPTVLAYSVSDPKRYGVVQFDSHNRVVGIEEKPTNPKSNWIIPGLYFYDSDVVKFAKQLKPSIRGELEITDLNKLYMQHKTLWVETIGRGFAWFDCGTFDSLLQASNFISTIQNLQNFKIADLKEIAKDKWWI